MLEIQQRDGISQPFYRVKKVIFCWNFELYPKSNLGPVLVRCATEEGGRGRRLGRPRLRQSGSPSSGQALAHFILGDVMSQEEIYKQTLVMCTKHLTIPMPTLSQQYELMGAKISRWT